MVVVCVTTIRDIARLARVSVSTASLAVNGDDRVSAATRERVLKAARQLDYHPSHVARSLSSGRTWSLHLINPMSRAGASSGFFTRFVYGLHEEVRKLDFTLALSVLDDEQDALAELDKLIRERRADGIILMNLNEDECLLARLLESGFPHVLLGHSTRDEVNSVDSDNEAVARDATRHLLASGRSSILFLNAASNLTFAKERVAGYRAAHHAEPDERLVRSGLRTAEDGRAEVNRCLAEELEFDSVLASSDEVAFGALRALRDAGLSVPQDIEIMGINNDDLTMYTEPRLSSVDLNAAELGRQAAAQLLASIDGKPASRKLVPHCLIFRESSRETT